MLQEDGFQASPSIFGSGVYALLYEQEVVYIGQAKEMLVRVYSHRLAWKNFRKGKRQFKMKVMQFDSFMVRPCAISDMIRIEREMINKYQPKYNSNLLGGMPIDLEKFSHIDVLSIMNRTPEGLGMGEKRRV